MGILAEAFNPRPRASSNAEGSPAWSDFWYSTDPSGYVAERGPGGIGITAETALKCGTVLAAARFRAAGWAMCPPKASRATSKGQRPEPQHPAQIALRNPYPSYTGPRWRYVQGMWLSVWGNGYSEMIAGPRSFADQLRPIEPRFCRVVDQRSDGTLLYLLKEPGRDERRLGQEKILHFRDVTTDGIRGLEMFRLIRNVVAIALLMEQHQIAFLKKGSRLAGLIIPKGKTNPDQRKVLKDSINEDMTGASNTGTFGILPSDVEFKQVASTNRDAQLVELDDHTIGSILRAMGVPGVCVNWADKTSTYASAKEFWESGGLKFTIQPQLTMAEGEIEAALLPAGSDIQIKFNMDALERSNLETRTKSLFMSVGGPFRTVNEARTIEDLERLDDDRYDQVLTPSNMAPELLRDPEDPGAPPRSPAVGSGGGPRPAAPGGGAEGPSVEKAALTMQKVYLGVGTVCTDEEARGMVTEAGYPLPGALPPEAKKTPAGFGAPRPPAAPIEEGEPADPAPMNLRERAEMATWLAHSAASQVVRRETAWATDKAPRLARKPDEWRAAVTDWYARHAEHVSKALNLPIETARSYCAAQAADLLAGGVAIVESWEERVVPRLVRLVLRIEIEWAPPTFTPLPSQPVITVAP
jgi:HK97 family phage portal protein